jgi:cell division protein FtsB
MKQSLTSFLSRSGRRVATVLAIFIALVLGYHAVFGANGLTAYQQKRIQDHVLKQKIADLQVENSRLQQRVDHLQSDPDTIKHEARVILRYAGPNEIISLNDKPQAAQATK